MLHHHRMHVENKLVEIVTIDDHEFEEIVEEYEDEILIQEEVLEPPLTDSADTAPTQGKLWCITPYFLIITVYICYVHLSYRNFMETTCIDIPILRVLLVQVRVDALLRSSVA